MWMHFNHDIAWKQLKENGQVSTLRGPGPTPNDMLVFIKRHGKETGLRAIRKFIIEVVFDGEDDCILEMALPSSGFESVDDWKAAALEMSGEQEYWRLFVVEVIK